VRTLTPSGRALAVGLAALVTGLAGCSMFSQPEPPPLPPRRPPVEGPPKPLGNAKYQRDLIMGELVRTHPVIAATLDRDLVRLKAVIGKGGKVNEMRQDMRLGPPLREACRLGWKDGIDELLAHGGKCMGDSSCETCVRNQSHTGG